MPVRSGSAVIRPESPDDHEAIRQLVAAAFESDVEAELVDRIRASPEYVPEMALVALVEGAVVGHVMVSHAVIRKDHGDRRISMLSPLAVHPRNQMSGIGRALVDAALAVAEARGEPMVILEGSPAYYGRFGTPRGQFVYLLEWEDRDVLERSWAAFMADESWTEIKSTVRAAVGGEPVLAVADRILELVAYPPYRLAADNIA